MREAEARNAAARANRRSETNLVAIADYMNDRRLVQGTVQLAVHRRGRKQSVQRSDLRRPCVVMTSRKRRYGFGSRTPLKTSVSLLVVLGIAFNSVHSTKTCAGGV
jgi:hypothetical protein